MDLTRLWTSTNSAKSVLPFPEPPNKFNGATISSSRSLARCSLSLRSFPRPFACRSKSHPKISPNLPSVPASSLRLISPVRNGLPSNRATRSLPPSSLRFFALPTTSSSLSSLAKLANPLLPPSLIPLLRNSPRAELAPKNQRAPGSAGVKGTARPRFRSVRTYETV